MIVVTGATGQLGKKIIENLLRRGAAGQIVASVRNPAKAAEFAEKGVHVRAGDFNKPDELAAVFAGAAKVLIISVDKLGEPALAMHRAAIEAACAAGAQRVFYTSHMAARADSPFVPSRDHAATEAMLSGMGVPFTSLRHGFYAESCLHMVGQGLESGVIRAPEDGPVSWTARADLAEADAILLASDKPVDRNSRPLTALQAITMFDLAAIASDLTGREIRRVTLTDEAWRDEKMAQGVPALMAEMLLGSFQAARRGDFAAVDPLLENLLGRPPLSIRDLLVRRLIERTSLHE